jgi:hypothetical protein
MNADHESRRLLARAVSSAVFDALDLAMNAKTDAERERWERHADKLESKFTTQHGMHYSRAMVKA